jgi:hypothetical protein
VATASAQATAQLNGRVSDESGAVLPGVTVTATRTDTTFSRAVVTDAGGNYVMTNLPTGPYRLEIALQGFRTYVQTGIVLQVGASPTINATLGLGNLEQTVSVEAAAPLVDVRSAGISEVVDRERIVELPLQGRQVTDLIVLAGAAVETGRPNNRSFQGGVNISVAGGLQFGVAYSPSMVRCTTIRRTRAACRCHSLTQFRSFGSRRAVSRRKAACTQAHR